jgi:hypothetical protein
MATGGPFDDINTSANEIMGEVLTRSTLAGLTSIKSVYSNSTTTRLMSALSL